MAENLNYDAGDGCWAYDNAPSNSVVYGRLYSWLTARKAVPPGWHLPSDAEWHTLVEYLGGPEVVGGKMKEAGTGHWKSPNTGATNESGFSALPGGYRYDGKYYEMDGSASFWSATASGDGKSYVWHRFLFHSIEAVYRYRYCYENFAYSVRCVRDAETVNDEGMEKSGGVISLDDSLYTDVASQRKDVGSVRGTGHRPAEKLKSTDILTALHLGDSDVARSKVDVGMTIDGRWGTFINGKSYQQMPLDTHKGWQYTTYYDSKRRLSIARRKLPDGAWQAIHFDDYLFKGNDNHNVTVLGICRKDGTIHLSFDHHNDPLHYRVSKPGVANKPDKVQWDASLFGKVRDWLRKGKPVEKLTYPVFVSSPEGNLLFFSRFGSPSDGKIMLCKYDPDSGG